MCHYEEKTNQSKLYQDGDTIATKVHNGGLAPHCVLRLVNSYKYMKSENYIGQKKIISFHAVLNSLKLYEGFYMK